jgi:hypothetical protein
MRRLSFAALVMLVTACKGEVAPTSYLFVWAGDSTEKSSDFLAVLDADPASPKYGSVVTSLPTGTAGTHPHHTEAEMPANGHLLANGFHAGRTWLFDLTTPTQPRILTSFGDLAGYSHPHTYVRLANGNILATFQYAVDSAAPAMNMSSTAGAAMTMSGEHRTGGLVEMDERGTVVRTGSARDTAIADRRLYPYSALPLPSIDRAISTTTDMDHADTVQTAQWVQLWRWSDLTLLKSVALPPGPRGDENRYTGEPRLLADGKSVYIHTFNCGLYLLRDLAGNAPTATFVKGFEGKDCGVPILTGHYWLQPVPATHSLDAYDISNPEFPKLTSTVSLGAQEDPHWIALDPTGSRVVLNSGGSTGNRLFVITFDAGTGKLAIDERFRDAGATTPGVSLTGKTWPHGFTGTAVPHGTVFSR